VVQEHVVAVHGLEVLAVDEAIARFRIEALDRPDILVAYRLDVLERLPGRLAAAFLARVRPGALARGRPGRRPDLGQVLGLRLARLVQERGELHDASHVVAVQLRVVQEHVVAVHGLEVLALDEAIARVAVEALDRPDKLVADRLDVLDGRLPLARALVAAFGAILGLALPAACAAFLALALRGARGHRRAQHPRRRCRR